MIRYAGDASMVGVRHDAPTVEDLEALRGPLTGYCYRMLGSAADADDAVQETVVRAYQRLDRFDPSRARLSTWVHGIATNVCLDLLRHAQRRAVLAPVAASRPGDALGELVAAERWLEPMPDSRTVHATDPADLVVQRESVRLAFLAALQLLPPRQRAVLLLRDVYGFSAEEAARELTLSVAAANSALQRARRTLAERRADARSVARRENDAELVERYLTAFQTHDVDAMRALLQADAVSSMPPFAWWLSGRTDIVATFAAAHDCVADRLVPLRVNGTVGFGQYRPDEDGTLRPFAIVVLELRDELVEQVITFLGARSRFAEFGLPDRLPAKR